MGAESSELRGQGYRKLPLSYPFREQVAQAHLALGRALDAMSDQRQDGEAAAREVAAAQQRLENVRRLRAEHVDGGDTRPMTEYSEDEYLEHIRGYETELLDPIASIGEWRRFKAAMLRWLEETDAETVEGFDQAALEEEHDA